MLFQYKFPEQTKKEIIKTLNYYHGLICNFETFCKLFFEALIVFFTSKIKIYMN